jgi:replicative DNA helicase
VTAPAFLHQLKTDPFSVASLIADATQGDESSVEQHHLAARTGFDPLDHVLGGGIRPGNLAMLAGEPGAGKTIATLQWARHMAQHGREVVYVCYEHDAAVLLGRLLCLEVGFLAGPADLSVIERATEDLRESLLDGRPLTGAMGRHPLVAQALEKAGAYAERLHFVRGSGTATDVDALRELVRSTPAPPALFVDYLQKVAVHPEPDNENEKVLRITEALKDLALTEGIPVICVAAAGAAGLEAQRLRVHHVRGSSAVAYECDIAMVMNEKFGIVSKAHVAFDSVRATTFKRRVVFSVEKNRGGPANVDIEFEKHFMSFRFDPNGTYVAERLVDERFTE